MKGRSLRSKKTRAAGLSGVRFLRHLPMNRRGSNIRYKFTNYFRGFGKISVVRDIFGDETDEVLRDLQIEFLNLRTDYIWVSNKDGHLIANANYVKTGEKRAIYLDMIHELVHVKQFREGRRLLLTLGKRFEYVNRPTELEAYRRTIREARRLGMSEEEIFDYLKISWLDEEELRYLARRLHVRVPYRKHPNRHAKAR